MKTLAGFLGLVRRLIRPIRTVAVLSAIPAGILIIWLMSTVGFDGWLRAAVTVAGTLTFATPAVIVWAFYATLLQISNVPEDVLKSVSDGWESSRSAIRGTPSHQPGAPSKTGVLKGVYAVGRTAIEARGLLIDSVGLVRLLNPLTLMAVLGAVVATGLWWIALATIVAVAALT